jgi:autotransporter-associated beta strand protein
VTPGILGAGNGSVTGGPGTWNTINGNWTADNGANNVAWNNSANDVAVFGGTAGSVALGIAITAGGLTFNTTGYAVTGNTLTLAGTPIVTTASRLSANIASEVQGAVGFTKSSSGTSLNNANGFLLGLANHSTGTFNLSGTGSLVLTPNPAISGTLYAYLQIGRSNSTGSITIGGDADVTLPAFPTARGSGATANITFDGGTLKPTTASAAYMRNLTNAFVKSGGARFEVASGKDIAISQALIKGATGGGGLIKTGLGALMLSGVHTYEGPTLVTNGSLIVASPGVINATSAVHVSAGATLGGSGTVAGTLTSSGTIAPGVPGVGTLHTGDAALNAGSLASDGKLFARLEASPNFPIIAAEPGMMEISRYWAPVVYQEVREKADFGRQLYGARDSFVAMNFDGDWDVANNWHNSRYHADEQGLLGDRLTPPLYGKSYSAVVESQKFLFLTYGFYHSGQDSFFSAARHQNDWETVVFVVRKDGSRYGKFEGMMTQFHTDQYSYLPSQITFSNHRPIIYIEPNGGIEGHGIMAYTNQNPGSNGLVYMPGPFSENVTSTTLTTNGNWNTAPRCQYKLVPITEMWALIGRTGLNDPYAGWKLYNYARPENYPTYDQEPSGGNPPWDRDFFMNPFVFFSANFPGLQADLAADSYVFDPYLNGSSSQSGPNNPNGVLPAAAWQKTQLGGTSGYAWTHRGETTLYHRSISAADDRFTFSHTNASVDFVIQGRVHSVQDITSSRAGLMIRNSNAETSRMITLLAGADQQVLLQYRSTDGGSLSALVTGPVPANDQPVWLRLERKGGDIIASYSYQEFGGQFTVLATVPISMDNQVVTGMAFRSNNTAYFSAATMTNLELQDP